MKIAITGTSGGFGQYAAQQWSRGNEIIRVDLRTSIPDIVALIKPCDIFFNHAYSRDTKQSEVFAEVFHLWENEDKVIINFGTSAIHESGGFSPLYVANKKHLINVAHTLSEVSPYKKVRIINFNPGTLENNTSFSTGYNQLQFSDLFKLLVYILEFNSRVEISDITIKATTRQTKTPL